MTITRIAHALIARFLFWGRRRCNICGHRLGWFLPYRGGWKSAPSLIRTLDIIGSDLDNFQCPWCGSTDRERHLVMYMGVSGLFDALPGMSILHFAPERHLSRLIVAAGPARYIKCDLFPNSAEVERVNIQAIPYPDNAFDLVIANHVLEHVKEDARALEEVWRILKPGGHAILQTPFSAKLHETWSDAGIDDDLTRLQAYGQEDHVRLFGRTIFDHFKAVGFLSRVRQHREALEEFDPIAYGVNVAEPFFFFQKNDNGLK